MKNRNALLAVPLILLTACAPAAQRPSEQPQTEFTAVMGDWATLPNATTAVTADNFPKIDGSTSTLHMVQELYWHYFEDETDLPEKASKTVPSYEKLLAGEADLILVPYASSTILEQAKEQGVSLVFYPFASEALVFITSRDNSAESITQQQAHAIYANNGISSWAELGGPDRELIPICRNADSGSQSQLEQFILKDSPMHPAIEQNYVELTMEGMLEQVAFYHHGGLGGSPGNNYALGYTLFNYLDAQYDDSGVTEQLKMLAVDGIAPSSESILDGTYPLADSYYAVVRADLSAEHAAWSVLEWIHSDEGETAILNASMLPFKPAEEK